MIGLVLVTHGRLAVEFGRPSSTSSVRKTRSKRSPSARRRCGARRKDIIEAVKRVDTGDGVAILTDMFGGTPSNLAIS